MEVAELSATLQPVPLLPPLHQTRAAEIQQITKKSPELLMGHGSSRGGDVLHGSLSAADTCCRPVGQRLRCLLQFVSTLVSTMTPEAGWVIHTLLF